MLQSCKLYYCVKQSVKVWSLISLLFHKSVALYILPEVTLCFSRTGATFTGRLFRLLLHSHTERPYYVH